MDDLAQASPSRARQVAIYSLAIVGTLVLCGWLYAGPYLTLYNIREAAQEGDSETLSELVDFPSLRESIKEEFKAKMMREMGKAKEQGAFAALGMMLAGALIDPMVDAAVTPSSIAAWTQGQRPSLEKDAPGVSESGASSPSPRIIPESSGEDEPSKPQAGNAQDDRWAGAHMGYDGLSKFVVRFKDQDTGKDAIVLVLRRTGFSWQLSSLRIPLLLQEN